MRRISRTTLLGLLASCLIASIGMAERVALVIGNSDYANATRLTNPSNDAQAVADKLRSIGFKVFHHENLTGQEFRIALGDFTEAALRSEMAMVFYAGHGIEMDGRNYLIPVDAKMKSQATAQFETVSLSDILNSVRQAGKLGMVLLDACRDNPFATTMVRNNGTRAVSRGLASVALEQESGILVSFAAQAGSTADDGQGTHSPYTQALLSVMDEPGLEINQVFRKVRARVRAATDGRQTPIERMQLPDEDIFLVPAAQSVESTTTTTPAPVQPSPQEDPLLAYLDAIQTPGDAALKDFVRRWPTHPKAADARKILTSRAETSFWKKTQSTNSVESYQSYLTVFPEGQYIGEATQRLAALSQPAPALAPTTPSRGPEFDKVRDWCPKDDGNWSVVNIQQNDTLFLRAGPDKNAAAIGELPWNAEGVKVESCTGNNWCKVTYGCVEGYSFGRYLRNDKTAHLPGSYFGLFAVADHPVDERLNVRSGPGTQYGIVAELPHNARDVVVSDCQVEEGFQYRWCTVKWQNISGWAYGRYLKDGSGAKPKPDTRNAGGSCLDLWQARNAIFHRRGYCFGSAKGKRYFSNEACFTQKPDVSASEQNIAARIKSLEAQRGC